MTIRIAILAGLGVMSLGAGEMFVPPAHAQKFTTIPEPGPGDPRIRQVMYDSNQVVSIRGRLGYEITVEFDPEERIENVSIGDSLSWQVTPNRKATLLFIKPMAKTTPTSMTVVTNRRLYSFLLTATEIKSEADAMLRIRFLYPAPPKVEALPPPPPPPPVPITPENFNFSYSFSGAKTLTPARVFDDGKATYFEFLQSKDTPAVFVTGPDGKEEMANTRISGRYTMTDFTAPRFILRYGKAKLDVKNDAWREEAPAKNSPPPAKGG